MHLFNERPAHYQSIEEATLLEKLNYCSCFTTEANANDGLPQYICMSCSILIENAYQLKILCAKTEAKFHKLQQFSVIQCDFETEQQQSKTPQVQIDQINDSDFNELNEQEHSTNVNSDEKSVKSNLSTINTELQEDVDLIEAKDTMDREQFSSMEVKPKTLTVQLKPSGNAKAAYQCEQCCKWFRMKTSLAIHMRSHTNERPYTCEVAFYSLKAIKSRTKPMINLISNIFRFVAKHLRLQVRLIIIVLFISNQKILNVLNVHLVQIQNPI